MSRIGNNPLTLPEKTTLTITEERLVVVKGPKGELSYPLPEGISLEQDEEKEGVWIVSRNEEKSKALRALHGTARALINNLLVGVSQGFSKNLEIHGVGFRAAVKGKNLDLSVGHSHPVLHPIPDELEVTVTENTKIKVEGINKQQVGQFASDVRSYYPPEPYKGKGIRYVDEYVRRKEGKSV